MNQMISERKTRNIIGHLKNNISRVVDILFERNGSHFDKYFKIMRYFQNNSSSNEEFEKDFINLYAMNVGGGLTSKRRKKFFDLLFKKNTDLEKIICDLYKSDEKNPKLLLSFATKLRHTVNPNLPIYDKQIASTLVLGLPAQENDGLTEKLRLENRLEINSVLEEYFLALIKNSDVQEFLKSVRKNLVDKVKNHSEFQKNLMSTQVLSDVKLLDSCLWALYKVRKNTKS